MDSKKLALALPRTRGQQEGGRHRRARRRKTFRPSPIILSSPPAPANRTCAPSRTKSPINCAKTTTCKPRAVDGTLQAGWLVLDFFDVIVHVMRADVREHYDLEGLWGDAPRVRPRATKAKAKAPRKKAAA